MKPAGKEKRGMAKTVVERQVTKYRKNIGRKWDAAKQIALANN